MNDRAESELCKEPYIWYEYGNTHIYIYIHTHSPEGLTSGWCIFAICECMCLQVFVVGGCKDVRKSEW